MSGNRVNAIREQSIVLKEIRNLLLAQLKIQREIFATKGEKTDNGVSQQDFYLYVKKELSEIKSALNGKKS